MCNLEKWYRWTNLQSRNKDTDIENKCLYVTYINAMYKIDNQWEHTVYHRELYSMLCDDLNGKEIQKKGIYIYTHTHTSAHAYTHTHTHIYIHTHTYIHIADALYSRNLHNIVKQLYSNNFFFYKRKVGTDKISMNVRTPNIGEKERLVL